LSLVVGLAVAQVLGRDIALKWPNDVCVRQADGGYAKLGGILLETQALPSPQMPSERWLVIGVGVNVQGVPSTDLRAPAVDLATALPAAQAADFLADVPALCSRLVLAILQTVLRFENTGFAPFVAEFSARDVLLGHSVSTHSDGQPALQGQALGVAADGSYQLRLADGRLHAIHSAEISLRPLGASFL
jgi:BirA family biotin operon repressor/biotin-[acetyl-CoA-carboxylase] ligase